MVKLTPQKKKDMVKYADDGDVRKKKRKENVWKILIERSGLKLSF